MSGDDAAFEAAAKEVERFINQRDWVKAYVAAVVLKNRFATRSAAWHQLHLIALLRGLDTQAAHAAQMARECPDYNSVMEGDFLRDELFYLVRRRKLSGRIDQKMQQLLELHRNDATRIACAAGLRGRLEYARGNYGTAVTMHMRADGALAGNPQWRANNALHYLKAVVMRAGANAALIAAIKADIVGYQQAGLMTAGQVRRVDMILRFGRLGCWLDTQLSKRR